MIIFNYGQLTNSLWIMAFIVRNEASLFCGPSKVVNYSTIRSIHLILKRDDYYEIYYGDTFE